MLTVLHIDDDPGFRLLLRELAEGEAAGDFRWLEASGLEEALAMHGASQPDLVLLDNRLGRQDGVQLLPQVLAAFPCPVWVLTGVWNDQLAEEARSAGAAGIATKDGLLEDPARVASFLHQAAATASGSVRRS